MRRSLFKAALSGALVALVLPVAAWAQDAPKVEDVASSLNTTWVIVAGVLVMFMQAGFAFLEIGFSRVKNAGTGIAKILANFSIAAICLLGGRLRARLRRRRRRSRATTGSSSTSARFPRRRPSRSRSWRSYNISPAAFLFFQFVFCAVSLAIVWGTTLERIKFGVYVIYAIVFSSLIYPIVSHWIFGGGWLQVNVGMQDFAGSTVVHLIGATGALAALLLLGPRIGQVRAGRQAARDPRALDAARRPRRADPVARLVRVQPGLDARRDGQPLRRDRRGHEPRGRCGRDHGGRRRCTCMRKTVDIGMAGNGAIAGLVAITAPSGYVEFWAAPIIGVVAGVIVVFGVLAIDKILDDPVGALSAHGLAGIWGTLSCGIFTAPRLAELNGSATRGFWYNGALPPARRAGGSASLASFGFVFVASFAIFWLIKKTIGLRVSPRRKRPAWTSSSTACTATRSSSSRPRRRTPDGLRAPPPARSRHRPVPRDPATTGELGGGA